MAGGGLEVSEHSIKHLSLRERGGRAAIASWGSEALPSGVIADGEIKDVQELVVALRKVRAAASFSAAHVSLPEQKGYLFETFFEETPELNAREAIEFTLEEHVPLGPGEAVFDYELLPSPPGKRFYSVTAFPRKTVESYYDVLVRAGFVPLSFELESQAAARVIAPRGSTGAFMAVDFGETRTALSIIDAGVVRFTTSLEIAGSALTRALQKGLGVSPKEAEKLKNEEGVAARGGTHQTADILLPTLSALRDEIQRHFLYWHTHTEKNERPHGKITSIILCGGNANVKGLADYFERTMHLPVLFPQVWAPILGEGEVAPIPRNESLRFATVAGLALRGRRTQ